jgi:hypothetical protein
MYTLLAQNTPKKIPALTYATNAQIPFTTAFTTHNLSLDRVL